MKIRLYLHKVIPILCLLALVPAYLIEPFKSLSACHLCFAQRYIYFTVLFFSIVLFFVKFQGLAFSITLKFITFTALIGQAIALRQVWLQYFKDPEIESSCMPEIPSLIDQLPIMDVFEIMLAGSGDCSKVQWDLFGISIAGYSFMIFTAICIISYLCISPAEVKYISHHNQTTHT